MLIWACSSNPIIYHVTHMYRVIPVLAEILNLPQLRPWGAGTWNEESLCTHERKSTLFLGNFFVAAPLNEY